MEALGTEMGILPMVQPTWDKLRYRAARMILGRVLDRLEEKDAHTLRNAIAKACLDVAKASGGHLLNLHHVGAREMPIIQDIAHELKLNTTSEGLSLLAKSGH
jgi:hypothetical protein